MTDPIARLNTALDHEANERALQYYQSMVTASSDLMARIDAAYTYRAVNHAYCDEHQRTQEELLGHTVAEVLGEEAFETELKPHLDQCLSGEQVTLEVWWNSPRQGRRHVEARYDPYFDVDGSVSGILVNVRDTTEHKQTAARLERSVIELNVVNRELEMFADSLAHDLKDPLALIDGFCQLLHGAIGDSIGQKEKDYLRPYSGRRQTYGAYHQRPS